VANNIAGRPWILDTAAPGVIIWPSWMRIAQFSFIGYAAQGNKCVINDRNGQLVWQASGAADLRDQPSFKIGWVQGMIVQQIDGGGKVLVYIE